MLLPHNHSTSVAPVQPTVERVGIRLKTAALERLFTTRGLTTWRERAAHLTVDVAVLHRACRGGLVGTGLLYAIRTTWPDVPYEQLFTEDPPARQPAPARAA